VHAFHIIYFAFAAAVLAFAVIPFDSRDFDGVLGKVSVRCRSIRAHKRLKHSAEAPRLVNIEKEVLGGKKIRFDSAFLKLLLADVEHGIFRQIINELAERFLGNAEDQTRWVISPETLIEIERKPLRPIFVFQKNRAELIHNDLPFQMVIRKSVYVETMLGQGISQMQNLTDV
jgi:hypothetical protein